MNRSREIGRDLIDGDGQSLEMAGGGLADALPSA